MMIDPETIQTITRASLEEKIRIIEIILESLKSEVRAHHKDTSPVKSFIVRTFDLGREAVCDRDKLYSERWPH